MTDSKFISLIEDYQGEFRIDDPEDARDLIEFLDYTMTFLDTEYPEITVDASSNEDAVQQYNELVGISLNRLTTLSKLMYLLTRAEEDEGTLDTLLEKFDYETDYTRSTSVVYYNVYPNRLIHEYINKVNVPFFSYLKWLEYLKAIKNHIEDSRQMQAEESYNLYHYLLREARILKQYIYAVAPRIHADSREQYFAKSAYYEQEAYIWGLEKLANILAGERDSSVNWILDKYSGGAYSTISEAVDLIKINAEITASLEAKSAEAADFMAMATKILPSISGDNEGNSFWGTTWKHINQINPVFFDDPEMNRFYVPHDYIYRPLEETQSLIDEIIKGLKRLKQHDSQIDDEFEIIPNWGVVYYDKVIRNNGNSVNYNDFDDYILPVEAINAGSGLSPKLSDFKLPLKDDVDVIYRLYCPAVGDEGFPRESVRYLEIMIEGNLKKDGTEVSFLAPNKQYDQADAKRDLGELHFNWENVVSFPDPEGKRMVAFEEEAGKYSWLIDLRKRGLKNSMPWEPNSQYCSEQNECDLPWNESGFIYLMIRGNDGSEINRIHGRIVTGSTILKGRITDENDAGVANTEMLFKRAISDTQQTSYLTYATTTDGDGRYSVLLPNVDADFIAPYLPKDPENLAESFSGVEYALLAKDGFCVSAPSDRRIKIEKEMVIQTQNIRLAESNPLTLSITSHPVFEPHTPGGAFQVVSSDSSLNLSVSVSDFCEQKPLSLKIKHGETTDSFQNDSGDYTFTLTVGESTTYPFTLLVQNQLGINLLQKEYLVVKETALKNPERYPIPEVTLLDSRFQAWFPSESSDVTVDIKVTNVGSVAAESSYLSISVPPNFEIVTVDGVDISPPVGETTSINDLDDDFRVFNYLPGNTIWDYAGGQLESTHQLVDVYGSAALGSAIEPGAAHSRTFSVTIKAIGDQERAERWLRYRSNFVISDSTPDTTSPNVMESGVALDQQGWQVWEIESLAPFPFQSLFVKKTTLGNEIILEDRNPNTFWDLHRQTGDEAEVILAQNLTGEFYLDEWGSESDVDTDFLYRVVLKSLDGTEITTLFISSGISWNSFVWEEVADSSSDLNQMDDLLLVGSWNQAESIEKPTITQAEEGKKLYFSAVEKHTTSVCYFGSLGLASFENETWIASEQNPFRRGKCSISNSSWSNGWDNKRSSSSYYHPFVLQLENGAHRIWHLDYEYYDRYSTYGSSTWKRWKIVTADSANGIDWGEFQTTGIESFYDYYNPGTSTEEPIESPSVVQSNGVFYMWFLQNNSVRLATSVDGIDFEVIEGAQNLLEGVSSVNWNSFSKPYVLKDGNIFYMFVHSSDSQAMGIWKFISSDGVHWKPNIQNPIIPTEEAVTISSVTINADQGSFILDIESNGVINSFSSSGPSEEVLPIYRKPIASIGDDRNVFVKLDAQESVFLDGSKSACFSTDCSLSFQWSQISGPTTSIVDTDLESPTFTPETEGVYGFELSVSDGVETSATETVLVQVATHEFPLAANQEPTNISLDSATLNGILKSNAQSTSYYFEYGPTVEYGNQTESRVVVDAVAENQVNHTLASLQEATTYHYRLAATNDLGTVYSEDATFDTRQKPYPFSAPVQLPVNSDVRFIVGHGDADETETHHYTIRQAPDHGQATITQNGLVNYIPSPFFSGTDTLTISVTDSLDYEGSVDVEIHIGRPLMSSKSSKRFVIKGDGSLWGWGNNYADSLGLEESSSIQKGTPSRIGSEPDWLSVSTDYSTLAIKKDGTLWGWGRNQYGTLGDGTFEDRYRPIRIGADSNWISVSVGYNYVLGLKADGSLWSWGENKYGRLGTGNEDSVNEPVQIGEEYSWVHTTSGDVISYAIKDDGSIWHWGYNIGNRPTPLSDSKKDKWVTMDSSDWSSGHAVALRSDASLWSWGMNGFGQLGDGTTDSRSVPMQIAEHDEWKSVSTGRHITLAIKKDGTLWGWGKNDLGYLGIGMTTPFESLPVQIGIDSDWQAVSAGYSSIAMKSDGSMWGFGMSYDGQLGAFIDSDTTQRWIDHPIRLMFNRSSSAAFPIKILTGQSGRTEIIPKEVSDDYFYSYDIIQSPQHGIAAIDSDGEVVYQPENSYIGLDQMVVETTGPGGDKEQVSINIQVSPYMINSGGSHNTLVAQDDKFWLWGSNSSHQLGYDTSSDQLVKCLETQSKWIVNAPGGDHTLAVKENGTLWAWGNNEEGELGDASYESKSEPTQIGLENDWKQAAAGSNFSFGIKGDGSLWSWGGNQFGQLGDGTTDSRNYPQKVGEIQNWEMIVAGENHALALKSDGSMWAWGHNLFGQLGDGQIVYSQAYKNRSTPTQIGADMKWISIAAGADHSLSLRSDGSLWAWGRNDQGQLGDGTQENRIFPMQLGDRTDWIEIAAGDSHSIGIRTDGTLWAWGKNDQGQLGFDSSGDSALFPVRIAEDQQWIGIAAGSGHNLALSSAGTLIAFGDNSEFQIGFDASMDSHVFTNLNIGNSMRVAAAPDGGFFKNQVEVGFNLISEPSDSTTDVRIFYTIDGSEPTITSLLYDGPFQLKYSADLRVVAVDQWHNRSEIGDFSFTIEHDPHPFFHRVVTPINMPRTFFVAHGDADPNDTHSYEITSQGTNGTAIVSGEGVVAYTPNSFFQGIDNIGILVTDNNGNSGSCIVPIQVGIVQLATGYEHGVGIKGNGSLWTWGNGYSSNRYGQLGDGTTVVKIPPAKISIQNNWIAVSAIGNHSFALKSDLSVWSWGENSGGKLGLGHTQNSLIVKQMGTDNNWIKIVAAGYGGLGIKIDGSLWGWGSNYYGILGDETGTNRLNPVRIGTDNDWMEISSNYFFVQALKKDGTLWAWGRNDHYFLGDGTDVDKTHPTQVGIDNDWRKVAAGGGHSLALKSDGGLWAWGWNESGQLTDSISEYASVPTRILDDNEWYDIWTSYSSSFALKADGTLWAWGKSYSGAPAKIGDHNQWIAVKDAEFAIKSDDTIWTISLSPKKFSFNNNQASSPNLRTTLNTPGVIRIIPDETKLGMTMSFSIVQPPINGSISMDPSGTATYHPDDGFLGTDSFGIDIVDQNGSKEEVEISVIVEKYLARTGGSHSMVINDDGELLLWGDNNQGQLGNDESSDSLFQITQSDGNWHQASAGSGHTLAIKEDSSLWAWGDNRYGQIGNGSQNRVYSPIRIGSETSWKVVTAGADFSMGIKNNGTLWSWGNNEYGQLGHGSATSSQSPVKVGIDNDWASVGAGDHHVLALKLNGTLWAWGIDRQGQLGDGQYYQSSNSDYRDRSVPIRVGSDTKWTAISAGANHSMAISSDHTLWACGSNDHGQLGINSETKSTLFVQVGQDENWLDVFAGGEHTVALKTDGTLWSWGNNAAGQLGIDATADKQLVPTRIGADFNWISIAAGADFAIAQKTDGSFWAWGSNTFSQLGDGTVENRYAPVRIDPGNPPTVLADRPDGFYEEQVLVTLTAQDNLDAEPEIYYTLNGSEPDENSIRYESPVLIELSATLKYITIDRWKNKSAVYNRTYTVNHPPEPEARTETVPTNGAVKFFVMHGDPNAGDNHSYEIMEDPDYGDATINDNGLLTYIPKIDYSGPDSLTVKVTDQFGYEGSTIVRISIGSLQIQAGNSSSFAIKPDGSLWGWGSNGVGQLGIGSQSSQATSAVRIGDENNWLRVDSGMSHTLALKKDGRIWSWGGNWYGQLGLGDEEARIVPHQIGNDRDWISISSGGAASFGIKSDGSLWTWGKSYETQGNGTSIDRNVPAQIGSDNDWVQVSGGWFTWGSRGGWHTLGLKADGSIWAWGNNQYGQLGVGTDALKISPTELFPNTLSKWKSISAGAEYSLAVRFDGTLWAWGINSRGQLGLGTQDSELVPRQVGTHADWIAASASKYMSMGLKTNGTIWAWGANWFNRLGTDSSDDVCSSPIQVGLDNDWHHVALGEEHAAAAKTDNTIWTWGDNDSGQLGDGTNTVIAYPRQQDDGTPPVLSITPVGGEFDDVATVTLSATDNVDPNPRIYYTLDGTDPSDQSHIYEGSILLDMSSTLKIVAMDKVDNSSDIESYEFAIYHAPDPFVRRVGGPTNATLRFFVAHGDPDVGDVHNYRVIAKPENGLANISPKGLVEYSPESSFSGNDTLTVSVSDQFGYSGQIDIDIHVGENQLDPGSDYSVGIKHDGTAWAFGYGYRRFGQVLDSSRSSTYPAQINSENNWLRVSAGNKHITALKQNGTLWSWGENDYGVLGDGTFESKLNPEQIGEDQDWIQISVGWEHNLGLKADGTVWAWGVNYNGELGDGSRERKNIPVQIGTESDWVFVSTGYRKSRAIKANGSLWIWGTRFDGQSYADSSAVPIPTLFSNTNQVRTASSSNMHDLAITSQGTLWAAGANSSGQLGNGSTEYSSNYIKIGEEDNWTAVSSGNDYSLAIKSDRCLWAWGNNDYGQIGLDFSIDNETAPLQIGSECDWISAVTAIGSSFNIALKSDGSMWSFGSNHSGQLGIGTYENSFIPNQVFLNAPPVISTIGPLSSGENQILEFVVEAFDPDDDDLTFWATRLPKDATFDAETRIFRWTPGFSWDGNYDVYFHVSDNGVPELFDEEKVTITIGDTNAPPTLEQIGNKTILENEYLSFDVKATDIDNDTLAFSVVGLPNEAEFDTSTLTQYGGSSRQTFYWKPAYGTAGDYEITFTVADDGEPSESVSDTITISVLTHNDPPTIDPISLKSVYVDDLIEFTVVATDPENDNLSFTVDELPSGAIFDAENRQFRWQTHAGDEGTYEVVFTATDPRGDEHSMPCTIIVNSGINNLPEIPQLVAPRDDAGGLGTTVKFQWNRSVDMDDESLTYELHYCERSDFVDCAPIDVTLTAKMISRIKKIDIAGFGIFGFCLLLVVLIFKHTFIQKKRKSKSIFVFFLIALCVIMACDGTETENESTSNQNPEEETIDSDFSFTVSDLAMGTTYFWKIKVVDERGGTIESEIYRFSTQ
ncbi:MAG: hypothetical protein GY866_23490 [Proteobacteria bacterium]|nr:hypothetical protein [Pseudomonadota bacterium]